MQLKNQKNQFEVFYRLLESFCNVSKSIGKSQFMQTERPIYSEVINLAFFDSS